MSTTEGYGAVCPECGFNRMLFRYGSIGWWIWDACTRCGYGVSQNGEGCYGLKELWDSLISIHSVYLTEKNLPHTREGLHMLVMSWDEPKLEHMELGKTRSVFSHSNQQTYL